MMVDVMQEVSGKPLASFYFHTKIFSCLASAFTTFARQLKSIGRETHVRTEEAITYYQLRSRVLTGLICNYLDFANSFRNILEGITSHGHSINVSSGICGSKILMKLLELQNLLTIVSNTVIRIAKFT